MSVSLRELVEYNREYLRVEDFRDHCHNGLQVEGAPDVRRLALGVSAQADIFRKAAESDCQAVLVHHGLFWKSETPMTLTGFMARRAGLLFKHDMSLLAYHLPLDAHPEVGNNAVAARALGLWSLEPFLSYHGSDIGIRGRLPGEGRSLESLAEAGRHLYGREPVVFPHGPRVIRTVGICSGGAASEVHKAVQAGVDAYITGEAGEPCQAIARECGIHFLAFGHYATERLGVRALGEHLARRFGLETAFFDIPNPA